MVKNDDELIDDLPAGRARRAGRLALTLRRRIRQNPLNKAPATPMVLLWMRTTSYRLMMNCLEVESDFDESDDFEDEESDERCSTISELDAFRRRRSPTGESGGRSRCPAPCRRS